MQFNIKSLADSDNVAKYRKEKGFYRQISMIDSRDGSAIVQARWYWPGRDGASTCYCCVWIHGDDSHGRGGGRAGGYGYHKESAALLAALNDAGAYVSEDIGGRGDQAMFEALEVLARSVIKGKRKIFRVMAHA